MNASSGTAARVDPPTSAGAIVMALGIFAAASLPRLPHAAFLTAPATALVCVVWLTIAFTLAGSVWKRASLSPHTEPVIESFGIGTWVAGTAVLARCLMLALPGDPWPARLAFIVSVCLWLWFIPRAIGNLARLVRSRLQPTGIILLSTVATQAVALVALRLFPAVIAVRSAAAILMALGAGCYAASAFLVVRGYVGGKWRLTTNWANGNCILHGALSITGLTAVVSGWFGADMVITYWMAVIVIFVIVELIEITRLAARVREFGWGAGVVVYDVSQWARNFTFGMLYAFTWAFAQQYPIDTHPGLNSLREFILAYGAYVVLFFLLAEAALMLTRAPGKEIAA